MTDRQCATIDQGAGVYAQVTNADNERSLELGVPVQGGMIVVDAYRWVMRDGTIDRHASLGMRGPRGGRRGWIRLELEHLELLAWILTSPNVLGVATFGRDDWETLEVKWSNNLEALVLQAVMVRGGRPVDRRYVVRQPEALELAGACLACKRIAES